jgi:hypothetical protein
MQHCRARDIRGHGFADSLQKPLKVFFEGAHQITAPAGLSNLSAWCDAGKQQFIFKLTTLAK